MQPSAPLQHFRCTFSSHQGQVSIFFGEYEYPSHEEHLDLKRGVLELRLALRVALEHAVIGRI